MFLNYVSNSFWYCLGLGFGLGLGFVFGFGFVLQLKLLEMGAQALLRVEATAMHRSHAK